MAEKGIDKKRVIWKFETPDRVTVSDASTRADAEKKFEFVLTRYKDSDTHEESLRIDSYKEGKENGSIVTTPYSLDSELTNLKRYGVMFSPLAFRDLRKVIEENYLDIKETAVTLDGDDRRDSLISLVKEFVIGNTDLVEPDFCYIPVNQFNGLAEDCGYLAYEMKTLRASLEKDGYIRKQGERYTVLHRINSKPERTIAFHQSKLNVPVPPKKGTSKKSGEADEK